MLLSEMTLCYADVLYLKVSFCQKSNSFSVSSILADGDTLEFRVHRDYGNCFSVWALGYAYLIYLGGFQSILDELSGIF